MTMWNKIEQAAGDANAARISLEGAHRDLTFALEHDGSLPSTWEAVKQAAERVERALEAVSSICLAALECQPGPPQPGQPSPEPPQPKLPGLGTSCTEQRKAALQAPSKGPGN